jgi:hypothetical protein
MTLASRDCADYLAHFVLLGYLKRRTGKTDEAIGKSA